MAVISDEIREKQRYIMSRLHKGGESTNNKELFKHFLDDDSNDVFMERCRHQDGTLCWKEM
jgi:hypothetical protein